MTTKIALHAPTGGFTLHEVKAYKTCSPYFVITRPVTTTSVGGDITVINRGWNITHVPSGLIVVSVNALKTARLVAGALSGLPIPWAKITTKTSFKRSYLQRKVGKKLATWLHSINRTI